MTARDWQRQYRLSKRLWHYQSARLDHEDAQMLKAIAKRRGTTVAELIRTYVTWGLEEDDSARRPDDRDRELIRPWYDFASARLG
jgi:hypothetical protein